MSESEFVTHEPCPSCGSKDNLGRYDDGHGWCFGCGYAEQTPGVPMKRKKSVAERPSDLKTIGQIRRAMAGETSGIRVKAMNTVTMRPINWLWPGMIPKGTMTLLIGDPGLGKSQLLLDIASRVSRGAPWPDGTPGSEPSTVLLLSAEDPAAEVLRPRLEAAGADLERIVQIEAGVDVRDGTEHHLSLETDRLGVEEAIREQAASLLVIDPLNAYLGKAETFKDNHVRSLLGPLVTLAEKYDLAIVALMHLNKDSSKTALHRAMGSVAFTAAARASFMVSPDPENNRLLLTPVKANLSKQPSGLAFTIEGIEVGGALKIQTSRVKWQEGVVVTLTADEATRLSQPQKDRPRGKAIKWLEQVLTDGPLQAEDVKTQAEVEGISYATLRRAKDDLGVTSTFSAETSSWSWALPEVDF